MEGVYVGQTLQLLYPTPHGYGMWIGFFHDWEVTIEAEWNNGNIVGKAVIYFDDGDEVQLETSNGFLCETFIHFMEKGGHR